MTDQPQPGRPFRRRLLVLLCWEEHYRSHQRSGRSTRSAKLQPLLNKIARGRRRGLPEWRLSAWSREADRVGRYERIQILPPKVPLPNIDGAVAKEFGLSARTVRRYRSDPRLDPFRSVPPWQVREWERAAREQAWLLREARRLLTPERVAKGGWRLVKGCLGAEQDPAAEEDYRTAWRAFTLQQWLPEFVPEPLRELVEHSRPYWLGYRNPWAAFEARSTREVKWINGQECFGWDSDLTGRRIKRKPGAE